MAQRRSEVDFGYVFWLVVFTMFVGGIAFVVYTIVGLAKSWSFKRWFLSMAIVGVATPLIVVVAVATSGLFFWVGSVIILVAAPKIAK